MKYGIKYNPNFPYMDDAEIGSIIFGESNFDNFDGVIAFHEKHPNANLCLAGSAASHKKNKTIWTAIACKGTILIDEEKYSYDVEELVKECKDKGVKFGFSIPVTKWDNLNFILTLGVSEVTIGEELCFSMPTVSKLIHDAGAKVKCYANVAQNGAMTGDVTDFFIRPEDVDLYAEFVDELMIHTYGRQNSKPFYEIYAKDKKWEDYLGLVIQGLSEESNFNNKNTVFDTLFGKTRLNCQKKCIKGGQCSVCKQLRDFANTLSEKGLTIEKE